MKRKVVVSFSGGVDSTTLLYHFLNEGHEVLPVFFHYGSKHNAKELEAAREIIELASVQFPGQLADLRIVYANMVFAGMKLSSSLMNENKTVEIPEGHYEEESMKSTVVPARNMIFLSILTGIAIEEKANFIGIGVHAGDHAIYPDCRPRFITLMEEAILAVSDLEVILHTPFLNKSKTEIVAYGLEMETEPPYHLTYTCYNGGKKHCGRCGACTERLEAFRLNKLKDLGIRKEVV